jgi:hypothetical protein
LFEDEELVVEMVVDGEDSLHSMTCEGYRWSTLMLSLTLLARRYAISRQDIE